MFVKFRQPIIDLVKNVTGYKRQIKEGLEKSYRKVIEDKANKMHVYVTFRAKVLKKWCGVSTVEEFEEKLDKHTIGRKFACWGLNEKNWKAARELKREIQKLNELKNNMALVWSKPFTGMVNQSQLQLNFVSYEIHH